MACDQDGGVVRCEAHLCPQYINNTSTCRVICTEYVLNTGRRPQTSERARKSPWNQAGQKGEKKARKKLGQDLYPQEGAIKEARFLHPMRSAKMEVSSRASGGERSLWSAAAGTERPAQKVSTTALYSPA